jgi:hypothetical protein
MANWKKVIVSGSSAELSSLSIDTTIDASIITLSEGSGSFSGSFQGDGSGLTNVPAAGIVLSELTDGNGINDFTYNGQSTATVSVQASGSTLEVGTNGVRVANGGIDTTQLADDAVTNAKIATGAVNNDSIASDSITVTQLSGSAVVTEAEGIASNDVDTAIPTAAAVKDYVDNNITAQDLDFAGDSGTGAVDLDSQSLTIAGGSGLTSAASGQTLTLNISASGVTNAMLEGSIANDKLANSSITIGDQLTSLGGTVTSFSGSFQGDGSGLTGVPASGIVLAELSDGNGIADFTYNGQSTATIVVEASGSTMTVTSTGIAVAASGITSNELAANSVINAKILDSTIANDKLANSSITLTADGGANQTVSLGDTLDIAGGTNITTAVGATDTVTVNLDSDITVDNLTTNEDLTVGRNLIVQGTASFQHTEDLAIADRFILLASGSSSGGDGGIVVQQTTQDVGEVFAFDNTNTRWGVSGSFDASQNAFTPDAFMAAVVVGTTTDPADAPSRYIKSGNIFVGSDGEVYIYS